MFFYNKVSNFNWSTRKIILFKEDGHETILIFLKEWSHQLRSSYKKKGKKKKKIISCQKGLIDDIFYYQVYCLPIIIRDEKLSLIDKIKIIHKIFVTRGQNCIYPCAKFIYLIIKLIDLSTLLCFITETFL